MVMIVSQLHVWTDVVCMVKEFCCNLVEHLTFERDSLWQYYVKSRDSVCGDHHDEVVADVVNVAYFSMIYALLSFKMKISVC